MKFLVEFSGSFSVWLGSEQIWAVFVTVKTTVPFLYVSFFHLECNPTHRGAGLQDYPFV